MASQASCTAKYRIGPAGRVAPRCSNRLRLRPCTDALPAGRKLGFVPQFHRPGGILQ